MKKFTKKQKDLIEELARAYASFDRARAALAFQHLAGVATPLPDRKERFENAVRYLNWCQRQTGIEIACLDEAFSEMEKSEHRSEPLVDHFL